MANEIFISYRRSDAGWAGRIYDRLASELETEGVFMDVEGISPGRAFDTEIRKEAENSKVMLTIIGDNWNSEEGLRRLNSQDDYVRIELEIGLRKKRRIVPILIEQTPYPTAEKLPETLRDLAFIQALQVTHKGFGSDVERLIETIKKTLEEMAGGARQPWDRTRFLQAAHAARGAALENRLIEVLDWVKPRYALKWGNGAKYGTAQILPNGGASTMLSIDTTGLFWVSMNNLQQMGVFRSMSDREDFIERLNKIQGIAIPKERAGQAFISFQIRNVDPADIAPLLSAIEAELGKIRSRQ